jgi:hypothetical protein
MSNQDVSIEGINQTAPGSLILQDMRAEYLLEVLLNLDGADFSDKPEKDFTECRSNGGQMTSPFGLLSIQQQSVPS